jgi:very-short-patch-repair endonuclease
VPPIRSDDRALIATTSALVEFLRDVALARRRRIVDVDSYDAVLWLDELPAEVSVHTAAAAGERLFAVPRVRAEAPPEPPPAVRGLINSAALRDSSQNAPAELPEDAAGAAAFLRWLPAWQAWAAHDRLTAPIRTWYQALAGAAHFSTEQEDQFELVLGLGLVTWQTPAGNLVRNHIMTTRLRAVVDADRDEVRIEVHPEPATRTQDRELLDGEPGYAAHRLDAVHDPVRGGAVLAPLVDGEPLLKVWAERALDEATAFHPEWARPSTVDSHASVWLAPAVILRRRERASLIGYYDAMLEALHGPEPRAPLGLAQLVTTMEAPQRLAWLQQAGSASGEVLGADPLFPLPANPEQMRIMERLRGNNGVVVQGPPGTGKTHTIANLIAALLAQGQRVLVTSQKAQALRVLRDKLPPEVAKLCVCVTDLDRGGSTELEGSVKAMSNRYASFDAAGHDDQVYRSRARRDELRNRVDGLIDQVRALREAETVHHPTIAQGYAGTLGDIARRLRSVAPLHDWLPVPLPDPDGPAGPPPAGPPPAGPPLAAEEAAELLRLLASHTPERADRAQQAMVDLTGYPTPDEVRTMMAAEFAAMEAADRESTEVSRRLDGCDASVLRGLRVAVDSARQASAQLGLDADARQWPAEDWAVRAITDGLAGRDSTLWTQVGSGRDHARAAQRAVETIGFHDVVIDPTAPGTPGARLALLVKLREYLDGGGRLRGALKSGPQRDAEPVLEHATVDGAPVTTTEGVQLVCAALQAQVSATALVRAWAMVGVTIHESASAEPAHRGLAPGEPIQRTVARLVDAYVRLEQVSRFLGAVASVRQTLAAVQAWLPLADPWDWYEFVDALDAVRLTVEANEAGSRLTAVAQRLAEQAGDPQAPPEVAQAAQAIRHRDAKSYAQAYAELAQAPREQAEQVACDRLLQRIQQAHPQLAVLMERTPADPRWPGRLFGWDAAWAWARADTFFRAQRQAGREQQLEAELSEALTRLRQETAHLAALQAWGHCLRRMTAHQAQALQAYEQHMRAMGKGTGRYANRYRTRAREAMREARDAVPAWVMPLDLVLDTLPPIRDSFDVVIVDEASQASLEDLFLLWLAPRVIVVGDDKQCAPSQVRLGELEPIFGKLSSYLPELPGYLRDAYTPKSSLFDLLRTRFGAVIPLREHFRCMPEIIEYSSRQFYADEPLVPLRQFGGDRLPPLRAVRVPDAVTEGTATRLRNRAEAEAIVTQIEACLADPAYAGKTFGVVVLQGTGQIQLISSMLLERVEPKEWERRRLRVGAAPDFQGDERDVVFVSMVVAEKRTPVTGTEWQRRYNVAGSRAKDQMWVYYSVDPGWLSPKDLRLSLLSYVLNPPPALAASIVDDVREDEPHEAFGSLFEQRVYCRIAERGFHVMPQVEVNGRTIDLVITGAQGRLAVECDGQDWPGTEEQREADLDRERELKRAGWRFWHIRESEFAYDPQAALEPLWQVLERLDIQPYAPDTRGSAVPTVWRPTPLAAVEGLDGLEGDRAEELDDVRLTPGPADVDGELVGRTVSA